MTSRPMILLAAVAGMLLAASMFAVAETNKSPAPTTQPMVRRIAPSTAYKEVIGKADLMVGGQIVVDPLSKNVRYYVAPEWLYGKRENFGKPSGLLLSFDQGKTWHVLSRQFDFKFLFVHPDDGRLYAIITYEWQETKKDGFLQHCFAGKVVVSDDGHHWKDITLGPGFVSDLVNIFQDPDHPKRICLGACVGQCCVIQYVDDAYSDWNWIRGGDWMKKHPTTHPAN